MRKVFDIGEFVDTKTEQAVNTGLVERFKQRRREYGVTQRELAVRSGVSYASVRRFETTGEISLSSLISLAHAIGCLDDFDKLFAFPIVKSLKDYKND